MDYSEELGVAIGKIESVINKYRCNPNIKICGHIGISENGSFNTGFNCEDFYKKISNILSNDMSIWDNNTSYDSSYYLYTIGDNNFTLIEHYINSGNIFSKTIIQEYTFLYKNTPFDIQILVFDYKKIDKLPENVNFAGNFHNVEYHIRNSIVVLYESEIETDEHIELEQGLMVRLSNINTSVSSSKYIAHDFLLRFRDIINLCEEINNGSLQLLSEYIG